MGAGMSTAPGANQEPASSPSAEAALPGNEILPADLSFKGVMQSPLKIAPPEKSPYLDFVRAADRPTAIEKLLDIAALAPSNVNMRWAGGCKGFSPEQVESLFKLVAEGSVSLDGQRTYQGAVGSGGTMDFDKDGAESVMICQVPYYMARLFDCVAWGSTPQTYRLRMDQEREGGIIVSKYGAHLDYRGHMNIVTQNDMSEPLQGWDGDVRLYMDALGEFAKRDYKVAVGVVNGGDVTKDEALLALTKNIPVIIVEGTGRAADELATAFKAGGQEQVNALYKDAYRRGLLDPDKDPVPSVAKIAGLLNFVPLDNPRVLSATLDNLGMLSDVAKPEALAANG
jgi:hypothetical protein